MVTRIHLLFFACWLPILPGCNQSNDLDATPGITSVTINPTGVDRADWIESRVLNAVTLEPLEGVHVVLAGTQYHAFTDQYGRYTLPMRHGFNRIQAEAPTFETSDTRMGVDTLLWPVSVTEAQANMVLRRRRSVGQDSDDLSDPDLREDARRLIAHDRGLAHLDLPEQAPRVRPKQALQPPATIRIYRRGAENNSCEGRVDIIPLEDYVKGVVPHEWIASWSDESLRAGSIAARSYAWGWIEAGGKYDCADLDDTTRSQVYRDDRTARASAATDSTAGVGVMRDGRIVRSEYSAENGDPTEFGVDEPLCTGRDVFGHGRGMCQWGTQRWSTQRGQTAEWMVEHYYPGATTSDGGTPQTPQPQIGLRQRISRVEPIDCPDPDSMFNCADFVNQGWSRGIFDLFKGHSLNLTVELTNSGTGPANDVIYKLTADVPYLRVSRVETTGAHSQEAETHHQVRFEEIPAGGMVSVVFTITGQTYSAPTGQAPSVNGWVSSITDFYAKDTWDSLPSRNEGQTFNEGDLKLLTEIDVFDARHWSWSSGMEEMLEGWTPLRGVQRMAATAQGLVLDSNGDTIFIDSPYLPNQEQIIEELRLSSEPRVPTRIWWRSTGEAFDASRAVVLDSPRMALPSGLIPNDVQQLRLEFAESCQITEFSLGPAGPVTPMVDSGPPTIQDAGPDSTPVNGQPGPDLGFDSQVDGVQPSTNARPRALRVRSTGGCDYHGGSDSQPLVLILIVLGAFYRRITKST